MGYDFVLFRLRRPLSPCPARIPSDFGADSVVPVTDPAPLHAAVSASPLFDAGSLQFEADRFTWRTPDGGALGVQLTQHCIHIDTQAHWDHVAELFDVVVALWPDTALFDLHKALVHDAASFREFVERAYREAAERARQTAPAQERPAAEADEGTLA
jgi:hypothetical protein